MGPARARQIWKAFEGPDALRAATAQEIAERAGLPLPVAAAVRSHLHGAPQDGERRAA